MHDRDNLSDEVPVADALEQGQETAPVPAAPNRADLPLEANTPDWQDSCRRSWAKTTATNTADSRVSAH